MSPNRRKKNSAARAMTPIPTNWLTRPECGRPQTSQSLIEDVG